MKSNPDAVSANTSGTLLVVASSNISGQSGMAGNNLVVVSSNSSDTLPITALFVDIRFYFSDHTVVVESDPVVAPANSSGT